MPIVPPLHGDPHHIGNFKVVSVLKNTEREGIDVRPAGTAIVAPDVRFKVGPFFCVGIATVILEHLNLCGKVPGNDARWTLAERARRHLDWLDHAATTVVGFRRR